MPETVPKPEMPARTWERRVHPRIEIKSKVFADLGNGTFGAITNISANGLAMRTTDPLTDSKIPNMCFRLTPVGKMIRPLAQVVWSTASKHTTGLRFESLPAGAIDELTSWIYGELAHEGLDRANAYFSAQKTQRAEFPAEMPPSNRHYGPDLSDPSAMLGHSAMPFAAHQEPTMLAPTQNNIEPVADSGAPGEVIQFPSSDSSANAIEKEPDPQSAELEHLRQLVVERTDDRKMSRKELQWAIAAALSLVLIIFEIGLWRRVTQSAFPTLGGSSDRSSEANSAQADQAITGPFEIKIQDSHNRQYVLRSDGRPVLEPASSSKRSDTLSEKNVVAGAAPETETAGISTRAQVSLRSGLFPTPLHPFPCGGAAKESATVTGGNPTNQGATALPTTDPSGGMPVYTIEPTYPISDAQSCVEGTVRLHATVDRNGIVQNLRAISGPPSLYNSAMNAARYWRFEPASQQGQPVDAERDINVVFRNIVAETR